MRLRSLDPRLSATSGRTSPLSKPVRSSSTRRSPGARTGGSPVHPPNHAAAACCSRCLLHPAVQTTSPNEELASQLLPRMLRIIVAQRHGVLRGPGWRVRSRTSSGGCRHVPANFAQFLVVGSEMEVPLEPTRRLAAHSWCVVTVVAAVIGDAYAGIDAFGGRICSGASGR